MFIVKVLIESDPACVYVKLPQLILEVATFVDLRQEDILGLLDATVAKEVLYLVFRWDLDELVHLRLDDVLLRGVILSDHVDLIALEVDAGREFEFELLVILDGSLFKFVAGV